MRQVRGREIGMIFQEPMTSLNPVLTDRAPAHRGARDPPRDDTGAGAGAGGGAARAGGHPGPGAAPPPVPAPVQRRHAPADDDRDGAGLRSGPHPGRRADHRARRDDPGPDPRADEGPLAAAGRRDADHHAQPGRGGALRRPRERDVRGQDRRARRPRASSTANPRHPYTLGLLRSVPRLDEPRRAGWRRSRASRPTSRGCRRAARSRRAAPYAWSAAASEVPPLEPVGTDHLAACWLARELPNLSPAEVTGRSLARDEPEAAKKQIRKQQIRKSLVRRNR